MRRLQVVLVVVVLANWALAAWSWPDLPERIPMHFDAAGRADGWVRRSPWYWFALPALGTALALALGLLLPRWLRTLARANSPWLNVPHRRAFAALPVQARERAVAAPAGWLALLGITMQLLLGWIVLGSARVAGGAWQQLPPWPSYLLVGAVLATALGLCVAGSRAVRREIARAGR